MSVSAGVVGPLQVEVCPLDLMDGAVVELSEHVGVQLQALARGATAAQGLGDGRPEMSESMPVFELYTSSACVAKPGFMT
jgi:hypothetical protein